MLCNFPLVDSYNKLEDDFHSEPDPLRAYNDYLEEIETISMDALFYSCHPLNSTFYSCSVLSDLAFKYVVDMLTSHICTRKTERFVSKQGHFQPRFYLKARSLNTQL